MNQSVSVIVEMAIAVIAAAALFYYIFTFIGGN